MSTAALPDATSFRGVSSAVAATTTSTIVAATPSTSSAADALLTRIVERIRTVAGSAGPTLEARVQDPELGVLRLTVSGRIGEVIQAELVVADRHVADALARAVDRSATGQGLSGIDLRIRTESSGLGGGSTGSRSSADGSGGGATLGGRASSGGGAGSGAGADLAQGQTAHRPSTTDLVDARPSIPVTVRRGQAGPSLDVRA